MDMTGPNPIHVQEKHRGRMNGEEEPLKKRPPSKIFRSATQQFNLDDDVAPIWPSSAVTEFRDKCACKEHQTGDLVKESSKIICEKAESLTHVEDMTVDIGDVEAGLKDLAELRSDGLGSFYSNFTPQGMAPPRCIARKPRLCAPILMSWSYMAFVYSAVTSIICNAEALFMVLTGCATTFVCSENVIDFRATYQPSAMFIGLIFPMVFLIGQTYLRREKAIERLATIKANCIQLILKRTVAGRQTGYFGSVLRVVENTRALFDELGKFLPQDSKYSGVRLSSIYSRFLELQKEPECLMLTRFMLVDFEKLRVQRDYRTPWKLNYFCFLCGTLSPVFMGPLFASMGCEDRFPSRPKGKDDCGYGTPGAYLTSFFFALVMSAILSIIKAMEDPFSLSGPDDVIATFALEANAVLHMIEEEQPGVLDSSFKQLLEEAPLRKETEAQQMAKYLTTMRQGQTDDADENDDDEGGGVF